tara:strand:+ start:354 stop:488 length:135 start_codon:yes stop_codon:yes gene_type:complete
MYATIYNLLKEGENVEAMKMCKKKMIANSEAVKKFLKKKKKESK